MSLTLKNSFFLNARGITFEDSASLTWTLNKNTNQLSGTVLSASAATSLAGGSAGALPYQSAANTTAFLSAGSNGNLLTLSSGVPAWEAVPTWNQNTTGTAANVTGVVLGANGGTGVANTGKTITIGGNLTWSGAFTFTGTITANTTVTFPTSGTLATTAQIPTAANSTASIGLTRVNGSSGNFMDAGSAPPLSQAIVPTWTGLHTFSAGLAVAGAVQGTQTVTCSSNSTPVAIPGLYPSSGILTVRDNTNGGTNLYIFDPNGGVQLIGTAQIASFSMALSGSSYTFTVTANAPRTFQYLVLSN
jgi:trimeric autotransporter adhesin